jgi:hypothetical protein
MFEEIQKKPIMVALSNLFVFLIYLVAGAGFEPATFGL